MARRSASPVIGLQRSLGNRGTTQLLARKGDKNKGTFEKSVTIGKLGPIEIKDSNIESWTGGKGGDEDLIVTTAKGKHSDELKRLAESKTKLPVLKVEIVSGQNTFITVTFKHIRITGYEADDGGKTEHWKGVEFDDVHIDRLSIGKPR